MVSWPGWLLILSIEITFCDELFDSDNFQILACAVCCCALYLHKVVHVSGIALQHALAEWIWASACIYTFAGMTSV